MKKALLALVVSVSMTSCATMFGGSKFIAQVHPTDPSSEVFINGDSYGTGNVEILKKRNKPLEVELKSPSGQTTRKIYENEVRVGSAIISFLTWGFAGPILDFATGSIYRPDTDSKDVTKLSTKKFRFDVKSPENSGSQ